MSDSRKAQGSKEATYWVMIKSVRNLSVKDYESSDRGMSGRHGHLLIKGALHIKPKGAIWDVEFPFFYTFEMAEHPDSGTLVFTPKSKEPVARLVNMALMDYAVENTITKMLGRVDFVPYDDRQLRSATIRLAASLSAGSDDRRALLATLRQEKKVAFDSGDIQWAAEQMNTALGMLKDVADVLDGRMGGGPSISDSYSEAAQTSRYIRNISGPLNKSVVALRRLR